MGIPADFNDIIKKQINVFAAWIPIVNKYSLGDYGIFADGVFSKLGNIQEDLGIDFVTGSGSGASIDFTSKGARVIQFDGGGQVDAIPAGAVNAKIEIEFTRERSFLVKSPVITVATIDNVNEVAKKLKSIESWDGQWKVVYQVFNAQDAAIVSTIQAGTKLTFNGDANSLGQMKLGSAGVNITTNRALGLKINGKDGVIGLGLFRIKSKLFGGWKVDILGEEGPDDDNENAAIIVEPDEQKDDLQ